MRVATVDLNVSPEHKLDEITDLLQDVSEALSEVRGWHGWVDATALRQEDPERFAAIVRLMKKLHEVNLDIAQTLS